MPAFYGRWWGICPNTPHADRISHRIDQGLGIFAGLQKLVARSQKRSVPLISFSIGTV